MSNPAATSVPDADPPTHPVRSRGLRARWRQANAEPDRGSTTELAIATPLLLLLIGLAIQAGLWMHGSHVAQEAANRAAQAAAAHGATAEQGRAAGLSTLADLGGGLKGAKVTVVRTATTVTVDITATSSQVIPGADLPVHVHLVVRVERWVPPPGQQP